MNCCPRSSRQSAQMLAFEFRPDKILIEMSSVCSLMWGEARVCVCVFSQEMDSSARGRLFVWVRVRARPIVRPNVFVLQLWHMWA